MGNKKSRNVYERSQTPGFSISDQSFSIPDQLFLNDGSICRSQSVLNLSSGKTARTKNDLKINEGKIFKRQNQLDFGLIPSPRISRYKSVSKSLTSLTLEEQEETRSKGQMKDKRISKYANTVKDQPFNPPLRASYPISKYKSNMSLEELEKKEGSKQMKDKQILKPANLKPKNQPNNVSQLFPSSLDPISSKMSVSKSVMNIDLKKFEETKNDVFMKDTQEPKVGVFKRDSPPKSPSKFRTKNISNLPIAQVKPRVLPKVDTLIPVTVSSLNPSSPSSSLSSFLSPIPSLSSTSTLSQKNLSLQREESKRKEEAPALETTPFEIKDNPKTIVAASALKTSIDLILEELRKTLKHKLFMLMNKDGYFSINHPSHEGVTCDSCENCNFIVDRYKCLICEDYDLCGKCFETRKISKQHAKEHPMVRYSAPNEIFGETVDTANVTYKKFKEKFQSVKHETAKCNGCDVEPIIGMRFKCDQCQNFNLCAKCLEEKVEKNGHSINHSILLCFSLRNVDVTDIEFLEELGSGAFGKAHKARLISKDKIVVCKVFERKLMHILFGVNMQSLYESFIRELNAYNEFNCNYIIKTYGSSIVTLGNENKFYLLTEYMENGSLTNLLQKEPNLSLRCRLLMACNIATGMRRIHEKKFIHRDIRPDNIFVNQHYVAKIGDMGIAKLQDKFQQHTLIGCNRYMPKEFITGNYNEKLDVYTFGLTLYHLFTGHEHSFENHKITIEEKPIVFNKLIHECLDDDPIKRPTSKSLDKLLTLYYHVLWEVISRCEEYSSLSYSKRSSLFVTVCNSLEEYLQKI